MILHKQCPVCNKTAITKKEREIAGIKFITLECGHSIKIKVLQAKDLNLTSEDGRSPYPFQTKGSKFAIETAGLKCGIFDEMGLGKTIQALMTIKNQNLRYLMIVKSGLRIQFQKETIRWCGFEWIPQIIEQETQYLMKTKGYIVSVDVLYRFKDIETWVNNLGIDIVILDECQTIKNHDSKRTNCVRKICEIVPNILALSGTPLKNSALEYFPILNILRPEKFPSFASFQRNWVDYYYDARTGNMKYGGIKNIDKFSEYTKDFIIRRTRKEVMNEIKLACGDEPKRDFRFSELGKEVQGAYQATMNEFSEYYLYSGDVGMSRESNILAYMSKMRHLTGLAKVDPTVGFVEDFIMEHEKERKICLFTHHIDVMNLIIEKLERIKLDWPAEFGEKIAVIKSEMDMHERNDNVELFRSNKCRIMVASTLASSEGLNLQFCSDFCIIERQWNPANEEQAEARFVRIGQESEVVNGTYFVATGTIDEFFAELVEKKRAIMKQVLDKDKGVVWSESSIIKELAEILVSKGKSKWKL